MQTQTALRKKEIRCHRDSRFSVVLSCFFCCLMFMYVCMFVNLSLLSLFPFCIFLFPSFDWFLSSSQLSLNYYPLRVRVWVYSLYRWVVCRRIWLVILLPFWVNFKGKQKGGDETLLWCYSSYCAFCKIYSLQIGLRMFYALKWLTFDRINLQ